MAAPAGRAAPPEPQKRGEVNELRLLLRQVNTQSDSRRKREVIRKVIAYMTLGIDVSRLFADMVLACNTKDLVLKKMIYLYLSTYARTNAELTLLAINTLQKDCRDEDPMIRGLALRALTSLQLPSIVEYVMTPLKNALGDTSGYVRQAGVLGVLKVYHLSPSTIKDGDFVDILYGMLRDREPQVIINCISALNELLATEGGIAINQAIVHHLLGKIREFSDWGQCAVLELVAKYNPVSEDELFGIMNLLDPCLKVAHSAVVLATAKTFIRITANLPEIQQQVFLRLKTPLLTLMASACPEVAWAVLCHVAHVVDRAPGVFDDEFKQFFCKFNEPSSAKSLKLGILPKLANPTNAREIVAELTEYVGGSDEGLARQAVRAVGDIAVRVPIAAETVIETLLDLVESDTEFVRAETVGVLQQVLRKYPERATTVIPSLHRCLKRMEDASGKASVIWMIGEYGQLIDDAPYILEPLVDGFKDETNVHVKSELLTATVKLFFRRPPEVQKMLGRLFKACFADPTLHPTVHDQALLYYRLLRTNVRDAMAVMASPDRPALAEFHEEQSSEVRNAIWHEFNTLSVVYDKPSEQFISADHLISILPSATTAGAGAGGAGATSAGTSASGSASGSGQDDDTLLGGLGSETSGAGAAGRAVSTGDQDLLVMDDLLGFGPSAPQGAGAGTSGTGTGAGTGSGSGIGAVASAASAAYSASGVAGGMGYVHPSLAVPPSPSPMSTGGGAAGGFGVSPASTTPSGGMAASGTNGLAGLGFLGGLSASPAPAAAPVSPATVTFVPGATIDPATYQSKWGALPVSIATPQVSARVSRLPSTAEFESLCRGQQILTMASGDVGTALKFFMYARDTAGALFLFEINLDKSNGVLGITIKTESSLPSAGTQSFTALQRALGSILAA